MRINIQQLDLTTIGAHGACDGTLNLTVTRSGGSVPCITHTVGLGPLADATPVPLKFRLDAARCGDGHLLLAAEVIVDCQERWWTRWLGRQTRRSIAAGEMSLPEGSHPGLKLPLYVPTGVSLVSSQNAPLDPVTEVDMPDQRLTLAPGEPNGFLAITTTR